MRPVGRGGIRNGEGFSSRVSCQLSVLVYFSFSYNEIFLSGVGFMAAQYTLSVVKLFICVCLG